MNIFKEKPDETGQDTYVFIGILIIFFIILLIEK